MHLHLIPSTWFSYCWHSVAASDAVIILSPKYILYFTGQTYYRKYSLVFLLFPCKTELGSPSAHSAAVILVNTSPMSPPTGFRDRGLTQIKFPS